MANTTRYVGIAAIIISLLGGGYIYFTGSSEVSMDDALRISENYLESVGNPDLEIEEIVEFELNYYVVFGEESTGMGAFEMLVDKTSGQIFPEYGHGGMMGGMGSMMGGYTTGEYSDEPISEAEAIEYAQGFLDVTYNGAEADDPHPFYGYYTLHTTMDGEIFGMLSVNVFTGQVWYHSWHGDFVGMAETH